MVLLVHIIAAISSLVVTSLALIRPSSQKLDACYVLAATALTSGLYLILTSKGSIMTSCLMGIGYFIVVSLGIFAAHRRLLATERS